METALLVSMEQYMATSYRPDCDYVDGELQERNVGKLDHSKLQRALIGFFFGREQQWHVWVLPEQRLRVSPNRVRIPDVTLISRDAPVEQVIISTPLACIEVLSEDDSLRSTRPRLDDYERLGVRNIWVLDPVERLAWTYFDGLYHPVMETLSIADSPIRVRLSELFDLLN